jgi:hypothetical protein
MIKMINSIHNIGNHGKGGGLYEANSSGGDGDGDDTHAHTL